MSFDDIDLSAGLTVSPVASPSKGATSEDIDLSDGIVSTRKRATSYDSNLLNFAKEQGLRLVGDSKTGRVPTGGHNQGSKHYTGQAIDVDYNGVNVAELSRVASARGFKVRDERTRPKDQKVWGGPHLHIEVGDSIDLSGGLSDTTPTPSQEVPAEADSNNPSVVSTLPQRLPVNTPLVRPRTPQPTGVTTNDISWHYGMSPEEFQSLSQQQQQRVISNVRKAVAIDQQKKKSGVQLQPSYTYINTMRKELGLSPKSVVDQRGMPSFEEQNSPYDLRPFLKRLAATSTGPAIPLDEGLEQLRDERELADLKRAAPEVPLVLRLPAQEFHRLLAKVDRSAAGLLDYSGLAPKVSEYLKRKAALREDLGNFETEDIRQSLPKTAIKAAADAGTDLAALIYLSRATGLSVPVVMAGETALTNSDKDPGTIAKETAKAYALGRAYEYLPGKIASKLNITSQVGTRALGAGLFGGAGAAQTAYEGGDTRQVLSQAIAQGALGTLGGPHENARPRLAEADPRVPITDLVNIENRPVEVPDTVKTAHDIAAQNFILSRRAERRAEEAELDAATGLQSPSQWKKASNRIDADPSREIVYFDANNLKTINDKYGHAAGDRYLSHIGEVIRDEASQSGITPRQTYRAGGDEFAIDAPKGEGQKLIAAIKSRVGAYEDNGIRGGIAGGVGETAKAADTAMYADKTAMKQGRPVETQEAVAPEVRIKEAQDAADKLLELGVIDHQQAYEVVKKASTNGGARKTGGEVTSARRADTFADRDAIDLTELPAPERKTWETSLANAKAKGLDKSAVGTAEKVIEKPRSLNDEEQSGLVLKLAQLKNEHKEALAAGDSNRIDSIEQEYHTVTKALDLAGTETARALAARKLTINEDYDLMTMIQRAKAKGIDITPLKRAQYTKLSAEIAKAETELSQATETASLSNTQKSIDAVSKFKVRADVRTKLDTDFASLKTEFANEWKRIRSGSTQAAGIAGLDPEGTLTKLIAKMVANRVKAGINNAGELVDTIHLELKDFGIKRREIAEAVSGYGKVRESDTSELATNLREMKRQLRLALSIEDAQAGKKPLKSGFRHEPDSPTVKELRAQLQDAMEKSGLDNGPADRLQERINNLTEQLNDTEAIQRKARGEFKPKATIDPKNQPLKDRVDELQRQLTQAIKTEREKYPYQGPKDHLPTVKKRLNTRIENLEAELKDAQAILDRALGVKKTVEKPTLDTEADVLQGRANRLRIEIDRLVAEKRKALPLQMRPRLTDAKKLPMEGPRKSDVNKAGAPSKQGPKLSDANKLKMEGPKLTDAPKQGPVDWLPAAKRRIQKRIDELERRIAEQDFSKKPNKEKLITPETLKLQTRLDDLKAQYETELHNHSLTRADRWKQYAFDLATVPKSIMSSADLSAPFRQGLFHTVTHPIISAKAFGTSLTAITNLGHARLKAAIEAHPDFAKAEKAGVDFTGLDRPNNREEHYISNLTKNLPIVKHSERAFTGFLDTQRLQVFSKLSKGINDPEALHAIARMINIGTGRADIRPGGSLAKNLYTANLALYSPRLVTSRFQLLNKMLNPVSMARMPAEVRGRLIADNVKFVATVATTLGLAAAAGVKVSTNPDDADFLKMRVGNTRYDIMGGLVQPMRATIRIMQAAYAFSHGDKKKGRGEAKTAAQVAGRFVRSKLSPEASFIVDWLNESDYLGQKFTVRKGVTDRLQPLGVKDMINAMREEGLIGGVKTTPGIVGVGVETYTNKKRRK